jgi:predicted nicotinamide N-methyase/catechol 2,3-dioxygenase-like lactoylglutathione lyase family enzyme
MLRRYISTNSSIQVHSLDHVCVCVTNIRSSIEWYTNVLSLEQRHTTESHFYPQCRQSPAFLSPSATATNTDGNSGGGVALYELPLNVYPVKNHNGAHFALRVDATTFAFAKHGGLSSLLRNNNNNNNNNTSVEYHNYGIQKSLFFHDPDNNVVELTLWGEESNNTDLHSLDTVQFSSLDDISLRLITPASTLYTATYNESPFDELPWWGFLWPGGNAIAKHMLENPLIVQNKNVLDFACGCGVGSIVALKLNCSNVIANDILPLALESARLNIDDNNIFVNGDDDHNQRVTYISDDIIGENVHRLLSKKVSNEKKIDVVIAGDVLYDDELARDVFPWFVDMAKNGTEVLVGDPGRWVLQEGTTCCVYCIRIMILPLTNPLNQC